MATMTGQILKGNDAKRKADLDRIKIAAEEYEKDHNCYPTTVSCSNPSSLQPYLNQIPCDPVTHESYYYEPGPGTCPLWFRDYAKLQNTKDSAITSNIGLSGADNYYVYSPNAPPLGTGVPVPPPGNSCAYGCKSGGCVLIPCDADDQPSCHPSFLDSNCGGSGCSGKPDCNYSP